MIWLPAAVVALATGSIQGIVTDHRSGLPISGVVVTISGSPKPAEPQTLTDGDGHFIFDRLERGTYQIAARRGGYFDGQPGQRLPVDPGISIPLDDGERRTDIAIALFKPAAIVGTVLDDAGEPVVKLEVRAYRREYLGGRPHYSIAGTDMTDDRGVYRIGMLTAGDFIVGVPAAQPHVEDAGAGSAAMPRDGGAISQLPPASNGKAQVFPSAYFPSGVTAASAGVIGVAYGEVRRNVDVQVRPAASARITGTLVFPPGLAGRARIRLAALDENAFDGGEIASIGASETGAFAFGGIPPGQYVLEAKTDEAWGTQMISIADADVSDIRVLMREPLRVSGRVVFDGGVAAPDAIAVQDLALSIERADGVAITPKPIFSLDRTGANFTITGLTPGRYVVSLDRGLPNWFLRSVTYQGRDVSLSAFDLGSNDVTGLVATLTDRAGAVTGTVSSQGDADAATVFVFPQDSQRWVDFGSSGRAFRSTEVHGGRFDVRDLAAGSYVVVAVEDAPSSWRQPEFLQAAARAGTPLQIGEGVSRQLDLRVSVIR